jgi:hypothetical protein
VLLIVASLLKTLNYISIQELYSKRRMDGA